MTASVQDPGMNDRRKASTPVVPRQTDRTWPAADSLLEFRLLGPLEVRRGGDPVTLGGRRQRALLALLCLHPATVIAVDRIVDELWGESPPRTARHAVEVHVSELRKLLGADVIATRAPGYLLAVRPQHVDTSRFSMLLDEGSEALLAGDAALATSTLAAALALWRGSPLADVA